MGSNYRRYRGALDGYYRGKKRFDLKGVEMTKTIEAVAMAVLGVVMVIVVLQRGDSVKKIIDSSANLSSGLVGALTGAPK